MSGKVSENEILEALRKLDPDSLDRVLDFISQIQARGVTTSAATIQTAHDLLHSDLVGLWADRTDIEDSLTFARQLRWQAEHRLNSPNAA